MFDGVSGRVTPDTPQAALKDGEIPPGLGGFLKKIPTSEHPGQTVVEPASPCLGLQSGPATEPRTPSKELAP